MSPKPVDSESIFSSAKTSIFSHLLLVGLFATSSLVFAQEGSTASKKEPDVIVFTNGDKLTGHLERTKGGDVTFKSDMTGEFTIDWAKVKELHTSDKFAVIPKNVKVQRGHDMEEVPQGTLSVADQKIEVQKAQGPPQTIPTADSAFVVDQATYQNAILHSPGFLHAWTGAITAGVSLVEATQKSNTFSGAVNLVRVTPTVSWLERRDRTTFDFNFAYGKLTQPGTADIKTDIYHMDLERDQYFSPRFFAFGALALDHSFSQGLDLQQTYGGGFGWTAIITPKQELDLKASMNYIKQQFATSSLNQNLIGSTFGENYTRKLPRSILFTEGLSVTPAWNNTNAYSALGNATLSMPVYHHFGLTVGAVDAFLNNPPVGFKKNSVQFTMGLSYTLQ